MGKPRKHTEAEDTKKILKWLDTTIEEEAFSVKNCYVVHDGKIAVFTNMEAKKNYLKRIQDGL